MDVRLLNLLMILFSFLLLQARAESGGLVVFLDSYSQKFLRDRPVDAAGEISTMSLSEVAAIVSVLLGFAPPSSLPEDSSYKLNEVLLPNPFNRPHAVFMLEVAGTEGLSFSSSYLNGQAVTILRSKILDSSKARVEFPGNEISVVNLDEPLVVDCNAACFDEELSNLANLLGGSYIGALISQDGELTIPLASGSTLKLHLAKNADLQFASSLVSLARNVKKAVDLHEDLAESSVNLSEILTGHFTGIEVLRKEYGQGDTLHLGMEILETTIAKLFNLLQVSYGGKIVGVIISGSGSVDSGIMLDVTFSERVSRWLEEVTAANTNDSEVVLVRRSLAWITGIILLVSTFIGIYLLMKMPLTRDTLLYSNVKLD